MAAANKKAVRHGLYAKLTGASSVTSLVGTRIYHGVAPTGSDYPFVIFSKQTGTPRHAMGAVAFDTQLWLVKVVARDSTSNTAEDAATAIDAVLNNSTLTLSSGTTIGILRESDIDYLEDEDGQLFRHHGGLYRISVQ